MPCQRTVTYMSTVAGPVDVPHPIVLPLIKQQYVLGFEEIHCYLYVVVLRLRSISAGVTFETFTDLFQSAIANFFLVNICSSMVVDIYHN